MLDNSDSDDPGDDSSGVPLPFSTGEFAIPPAVPPPSTAFKPLAHSDPTGSFRTDVPSLPCSTFGPGFGNCSVADVTVLQSTATTFATKSGTASAHFTPALFLGQPFHLLTLRPATLIWAQFMYISFPPPSTGKYVLSFVSISSVKDDRRLTKQKERHPLEHHQAFPRRNWDSSPRDAADSFPESS